MSNIHYIKNVTFFATFADQEGVFSKQLSSMPDFTPDEIIVRGINFNGILAESDHNMYLLWSNITNDYIGSFYGGSKSTFSPQSVFKLTSPISNMIEFKVFTPNGGDTVRLEEALKGDLAIHLDFIKYKRPTILPPQEQEKEQEKNI
jgi:hypothetical protein